MRPEAFEKLNEVSRNMGESNDCSVIAWSVVTGDDYAVSHDKLARLAKRPARRGPEWHNYLAAFVHEGYRLEDCTEAVRRAGGKTAASLDRLGLKGCYLAAVSGGGHVLAVRDGRVVDWTSGRRHRVVQIWRVVRCRKSEPGITLGPRFGRSVRLINLYRKRLNELKREAS